MSNKKLNSFDSSSKNPVALTREKTIEIHKNGTLYISTRNRYKKSVKVCCNRCYKTNLDSCIGYEDYDLCLPCNQEISRQLKKEDNKEEIDNEFWSPTPLSDDDSSSELSMMMQDMFYF